MGESHQVLIKALDLAAGDTNGSLASNQGDNDESFVWRQLPVSCLSRKAALFLPPRVKTFGTSVEAPMGPGLP